MESVSNRTVPKSAGPSEIQLQFCMICLDTSEACKLYPANTYNLDLEFEHLTGLSLLGELSFQPHFCTECAQRFSNCSKFRNKCLTAYHLLLGLVENEVTLTTHNIEILGQSNNLTSSITKKSLQPNHCDLYLIHKEKQEQEIQRELIPNNKPIQMAVELLNGKLVLNPVPKNVDTKNLQEKELPNNKTIKIGLKCVNGNLILNPVPENEDTYNIETENFDDFQTNVEYLEDIDFDLGHDEKLEKVDSCKNDIDNNCIYSKDNNSDFDWESDIVNNENVKFAQASDKYGRIRVIHESVLKTTNTFKEARNAIQLERLSSQYKITILTHEEQIDDIQKRKEKNSFKNSPYKCMTCFRGFPNENGYRTHMERHTEKSGKFVCAVCGVHYRRQCLLNSHTMQVHSTRYSCISCPLVTCHRSIATTHMNWHRGVTYECPHCFERARSRTGYLSHLRIAHPSDVVCHLCGYSFISQKGIQQHLRLKHRYDNVPNPEGPVCEPCNIRFASETAYHQHLTVSPKHAAGQFLKRNQPCQARQAPRPRPREGSKRVTCEQCGTLLIGLRSYRAHFTSSHPDVIPTQYRQRRRDTRSSHLCEKCGRSFPKLHCMMQHMMKAHSTGRSYQCDVCKRVFYFRHQLLDHVKAHEQPSECPVCQKKFLYRANRDRHLWTHRSVRPVKCTLCDRTFVNRSVMLDHVGYKHYKKPYPRKNTGCRLRASRKRDDKEVVFSIARQNGT